MEQLGKKSHDHLPQETVPKEVLGPIIVGAGPSGLATAACLKEQGIPSFIIEKEDSIAHLWKNKAYDRLKLHTPKENSQLPFMSFPTSYPTFPSRKQFVDYLDAYARKFHISPRFCEKVECAQFSDGKWHVRTSIKKSRKSQNNSAMVDYKEYVSKWLVVATGENDEPVIPHIPGLEGFNGKVIHSSEYKNGVDYKGQKVLVVGCGNSGMEIALDLFNCGANPSLVIRSPVHILPLKVLGISIFTVAMKLMKVFSIQMVDRLLVMYARIVLGNTASFGLQRPHLGPLELKFKIGKTPILDVGTFTKICKGDVKVLPEIKRIGSTTVHFVNNSVEEYDQIIFTTGYRSTVQHWLKDHGELFSVSGHPKTPFPNNWKGKEGLYAAGFSKRGLLGTSTEAMSIAQDIKDVYISNESLKS